MNFVYAEGSTKSKRTLAEDVVSFCIDQLMPRMKTLDVSVQLSNNLEPHVHGFCCAIDTREFELEVNAKLTKEDFITTICHEMVHVMQYARRRLGIDSKRSYETYDEYLDLWYEIEARELEKNLVEKYNSLKTLEKKI